MIPVEEKEVRAGSLISQIFTKDYLKMLYYHACRVDIPDVNDKADLCIELLGPEFQELGPATNRVAFLYTPSEEREFKGGAGLVFKIALDRRGFVDNWTEYKRSIECPEYFVKAYECNMLILVEEYVTLMDMNEFLANENGIKMILEDLSKRYVFEDIGFDTKNFENWGYRSNGEMVVLDLGYVYNIRGSEQALTCPKCGGELGCNRNYTGFLCQNAKCRTKYDFIDVRRRMSVDLEDFENQMISTLNNVEMPDFENITNLEI